LWNDYPYQETVMMRWMLLGVCMLTLASCGGNAGANTAAQAGGVDHSTPEAVFAAYSTATDLGDVAGIERVLVPSQRGMTSGATGVPEANRGYTIVRREDRSASEVRLHVKFKMHDEVMPHVLVLQDGKWYLDMEKTGEAMMESMTE
jgi:hypothetical protein